jgi:hypothetical protein
MLNHRTASQPRAHGFLSAAWPEENCAFIDFTGDDGLPAFQAQASILFSGFGLTGQSHLAQQLTEGFAFLGERPALGIQVEFMSYPQQTPQGKAMREWIVTQIRPISRRGLLEVASRVDQSGTTAHKRQLV